MNKIDNAIKTVHHMDSQANQKGYLNRIHPLAKLLITIIYIISLTSIDKYNLVMTLAMSIYLILVSIIGDLSIKKALKSLKVVLLLLVILGIANPILDRTIITYIGIVPITTGMISMCTLLLKGIFAILASYFLILTTSIEEICYALKMIHMPNILITVIMLIYRYIIVFLKEVQRIWTAYQMRAPKQKGAHYKAWGSLIGSLMLRSIDRAQVVYESMELRGFDPDTFFVKKEKVDKKSWGYFLLMLILLIILRFVPIFEIMGSIFI